MAGWTLETLHEHYEALRAADLRILVLSNAVPQTWFAGSLLLYRLLQSHPPERLKAVGPVM